VEKKKTKQKALVFLNMGGARSKDELATFLRNMFNDEIILKFKMKLFVQWWHP
jgi:ferrochelatase